MTRASAGQFLKATSGAWRRIGPGEWALNGPGTLATKDGQGVTVEDVTAWLDPNGHRLHVGKHETGELDE